MSNAKCAASGTFWEYAYVYRNVQSWVRTHDLSYGHHKLVASLTPDEQKEALAYAVEQRLSISGFRKALRGNKKVTRALPHVSEDEGSIIVSDIQWFAANLHAFESLSRDERQAAILRVKKLLKLWESVSHD